MKKKKVLTSVISIFILAVFLVLYIYKSPSLLLRKDGITEISVSSKPERYNYSFDEADADVIVDYLSSIELISDFSENPDEYIGMVWVISLEYENGDIATIYHVGNKFIKGDNGTWYKMNYDEANQFELLLEELDN